MQHCHLLTYGLAIYSVVKINPNKAQRQKIYFPAKFQITLRKHAYPNILNISPPKLRFSDKNSDIFHISAQNIVCGYSLEPPRRGGSNEYSQSIFEQK